MLAFFSAFFLYFSTGCSNVSTNSEEQTSSKSVLLVVMDTTRRDSFGAYGDSRDTTPNFDMLSERDFYFKSIQCRILDLAFSCFYFHRIVSLGARCTFYITFKKALSLDPDPLFASNIINGVPTIAEILTSKGYDCVSVSANRLIGPDFPLVRGFSESYFLDDDSKVTQKVQDILQKRRDQRDVKPLFLFVKLMSAHSPWFRNPVPWVMQYQTRLHPVTSPEWLKPYLLPEGIGIHPYLSHNNSNMIFSHISQKDPLEEEQLNIIQDLYEGEVHRADSFWEQLPICLKGNIKTIP